VELKLAPSACNFPRRLYSFHATTGSVAVARIQIITHHPPRLAPTPDQGTGSDASAACAQNARIKTQRFIQGASSARDASNLSDLMNRSEKRDTRGQILTILQDNSYFIAQKNDGTWTE